MENASQALLIAGGVLIALLVISLGVYIFGTASSISEEYDRTMSATEISKFNAKFEGYDKDPYYVEDGVLANDPNLPVVKYLEAQIKGKTDKTKYSLTNYNTVSDVVSAINLAYTINSKNNYDVQSGVQVSVSNLKVEDEYIEYNSKKLSESYGVTPLVQKKYNEKTNKEEKNKDKNMMYLINNVDNKLLNNTEQTDLIPLNILLQKFSESMLSKQSKRVYKYGFKGEVSTNPETGLIDIIKFTLVENVTYVTDE